MAVNYTTVEPPDNASRDGGLGKRNQKNVAAIFSSSPINQNNDYTAEKVNDIGISVLNGQGGPGDSAFAADSSIKNGIVNDGGYMFDNVDLKFAGRRIDGTVDEKYSAPNLMEVELGGEGLPASPYTPNPTSPGEGNGIDPSQQPEFTGILPSNGDPGLATSKQFGRGDGSAVNPVNSSADISRATIGKFMLGTSKIGS
jgi:hypothetical protein